DALYVQIGKNPEKDGQLPLIFAAIGAGLVVAVAVMDRIRTAWSAPQKHVVLDWKPGDRCLAQWPGDKYYYAGMIQRVTGQEYTIFFDDTQQATVSHEHLASPDLEPGTRIFGRWMGGNVYFPGKVMQRNGEQLLIHYDDGDKEWTTLTMVRVVF